GAVSRVVFGDGGRSGGPAEPVVEGAESDQEAERNGNQLDRGDRVGFDERVPAIERADTDVEREPEARRDEDAEHRPAPTWRPQLCRISHALPPPSPFQRSLGISPEH